MEENQQIDAARHEYEALKRYYYGPEAKFFHALLLKKSDDNVKAKTLLGAILDTARISGKHYNQVHKEWLVQAKRRTRRIKKSC